MQHNCINRRQSRTGRLCAWECEKDGAEVRVRVDGQLTFNSSEAMVDAALEGYGISYVPESLVGTHIANGRLQLVLNNWSPKFAGYFLY